MTTQREANEMVVLLSGRCIGRVLLRKNCLEFVYDEAWREQGPMIPLSMSMPLSGARYGHEAVSNWMWGLLSDHDRTLSYIASQHHVSANNVFALLQAVGEDCAGAVQFAKPDHTVHIARDGDIQWLDDVEIGARLARLKQNHSTGRLSSEGQFSLAGMLPKTALIRIGNRWGAPSGRIPTTHILKPPIADLDGHAQNEVFCLRLAERVGLRAARADVRRFGDEWTIVVERYDRLVDKNGDFVRIHQEDLCQAMGIHPARKYEKDGGPGIKEIMDLLSWSSRPKSDRRRFMEATALNFIIAGTDAHAKNHSILFGPKQIRLAPLYDIASYLPYCKKDGHWETIKIPMTVDGRYHYAEVTPLHWQRMAKSCGYPGDEAIGQVAHLAAMLPSASAVVADELRAEGVGHPVLDILVDRISWRCAEIERAWGQPGA